ncbi:MAG: putative lipid II flippase FtsW [Solirubrobacterales bacterium]|nr:putative lipid II flippase FtsW [Solirubrobacterales bacterium]
MKRLVATAEYQLLFTACLALVAIGVVMVFSASSTTQILDNGGLAASTTFLKKTLIAVVIGMILFTFATRVNLSRVRELTPAFGMACILALLAVLLLGTRVAGTKGWFFLGPVQFQPVEFLKLALVLYGANLLADRPDRLKSVREMGPYLVFTGVSCFLVLLQPDMGSALIAMFAVGATLVAAGARPRDLGLLIGAVSVGGLLFALAAPYRRDRLLTFLNPDGDVAGTGFQTIQAKIAIGSGGLGGVGIGNGVQKAFYLPEAHTDMIPAVIGEEFGFVGLAVVIALFGMISWSGYRIAIKAKDSYGRILAGGLTSLILIQACLNLYAVMGMAPLTGVPLPLVSYGNNSLIVSLVAIGLILNVARGGCAATVRRPDARGRTPGPARLRVIEGQGQIPNRRRTADASSRNADGRPGRRRHSGTRRPRPGDSRRAS